MVTVLRKACWYKYAVLSMEKLDLPNLYYIGVNRFDYATHVVVTNDEDSYILMKLMGHVDVDFTMLSYNWKKISDKEFYKNKSLKASNFKFSWETPENNLNSGHKYVI